MNGVAETEKKRKKRGERGVEREIDVKRITISQPGAEHCSMDLGIRMRYHRHGLRAVHWHFCAGDSGWVLLGGIRMRILTRIQYMHVCVVRTWRFEQVRRISRMESDDTHMSTSSCGEWHRPLTRVACRQMVSIPELWTRVRGRYSRKFNDLPLETNKTRTCNYVHTSCIHIPDHARANLRFRVKKSKWKRMERKRSKIQSRDAYSR